MPIYAYKCASCGQSKDVLQKYSDAPLTVCPFCGEPAFTKQVTAAGFQLKGSGWYATDFRGGNSTSSAPASATSESGGASAKGDAKPAELAAKKAGSPAPPSSGGSSSGSGSGSGSGS